MRLIDGVFIVVNASHATINCNETIQDVGNCSTCLVTLDCGCTLSVGHASDGVHRRSGNACEEGKIQTNTLHTLNLAVLTAFYDIEGADIKGQLLMGADQLQVMEPLDWNLLSANTSRLLAADDVPAYNLRKLAASLQNESVVVRTASEALLLDYIELQNNKNMFWSFSNYGWTSYAICFLYIIMGFLLLLHYMSKYRPNGMGNVAFASPLILPKATAFGLRTTPSLSTSTTQAGNTMDDVIQWLQTMEFYEITGILYCIFMGAFLVACICFIKQLYSRRSYVYVDLCSDRCIHSIKLMKLPDATRDFTINLTVRNTILRVSIWGPIGIITFESAPWKVVRGRDGKIFPCPSRIFISARRAYRVRAMQANRGYRCKPLVIHSHQYEFNDLRNSGRANDMMLSASAPPLYEREDTTYV